MMENQLLKLGDSCTETGCFCFRSWWMICWYDSDQDLSVTRYSEPLHLPGTSNAVYLVNACNAGQCNAQAKRCNRATCWCGFGQSDIQSSRVESESEWGWNWEDSSLPKTVQSKQFRRVRGRKKRGLTVGANVGSLLMFCYQDLWCFFPHHQIMIRTWQRQSDLLFFYCS